MAYTEHLRSAGFNRLTMRSLVQVLHNMADHARTLLDIFGQQPLPADFSQRLTQHILLEEEENAALLLEIHNASPSRITQKALDHSYFMQALIQDENAIPITVKRELLDHFVEEHEIWQIEMDEPAEPYARGWTVGPLWPKGG